jgi:hypothetical protein
MGGTYQGACEAKVGCTYVAEVAGGTPECGDNASCEDISLPGTGYRCACDSGYGGFTADIMNGPNDACIVDCGVADGSAPVGEDCTCKGGSKGAVAFRRRLGDNGADSVCAAGQLCTSGETGPANGDGTDAVCTVAEVEVPPPVCEVFDDSQVTVASYDEPFTFTVAARGTSAFEVQSMYNRLVDIGQGASFTFVVQNGMAVYNFGATDIFGASITNDAGIVMQIDQVANPLPAPGPAPAPAPGVDPDPGPGCGMTYDGNEDGKVNVQDILGALGMFGITCDDWLASFQHAPAPAPPPLAVLGRRLHETTNTKSSLLSAGTCTLLCHCAKREANAVRRLGSKDPIIRLDKYST